jgi:hypothetical protein
VRADAAVDVTQGDDGCTPAVIEATPGEKLDLRVKNETGGTYEIEGIDGTNLEEVLVPENRERSIGYNVPDEGGTHKVKCYVPGRRLHDHRDPRRRRRPGGRRRRRPGRRRRR